MTSLSLLWYYPLRITHFLCSVFSVQGEQLFPIIGKNSFSYFEIVTKAHLAHIFALFRPNNPSSFRISSRISFLLKILIIFISDLLDPLQVSHILLRMWSQWNDFSS